MHTMQERSRRRASLAATLALVVALPACDRTPTGGGHADVGAVRLTIGAQAQVVTVTAAGVQTPATFSLAAGAHAVTVTWLDVGGNAITGLGSQFSLAILPGAGVQGVAFSASGLYAGTLTLTGTGAKSMVVRLIDRDHADFSQSVSFTVQ
jgi:hypothetical protein